MLQPMAVSPRRCPQSLSKSYRSRVLFDVLLNRTGVLVGVHQRAGLVGQAIGLPTALHQESQVTQAGIQDLGSVMAGWLQGGKPPPVTLW